MIFTRKYHSVEAGVCIVAAPRLQLRMAVSARGRCRREGKFKVRRARLSHPPPFCPMPLALLGLLRLRTDVMLHISVAVKVVPLPFYRWRPPHESAPRLLRACSCKIQILVVASSVTTWSWSLKDRDFLE